MMTMANILVVVQIVMTIITGAIAWLFKRAIGDIDRRQGDCERRIDRLEQSSVTKEEWIRESGITRRQLTEVTTTLAKMEGQNQLGIQIGAALQAAINAASKEA
jgi:hypothetical protein